MTQEKMQHLFILCYGRTGSTVVQGLLNRLNGYCIRGERKWVLTALAKAAGQAAKERAEFAAGDLRDGVRSPHYGISETDPDHFAKILAETYTTEMLTPPPGTRVCGTKDVCMASHYLTEAEFQHVINFIFDHFSSPRIVFLTRRADEVAKSGWWVNRDPESVREIVSETDQRFAKICQDYPDSTFHLDYSEFNNRVDGFRRLLEWLGEPIDEEVLADVASTRLMHMKENPSSAPEPPQGLIRRVGRKIKRSLGR